MIDTLKGNLIRAPAERGWGRRGGVWLLAYAPLNTPSNVDNDNASLLHRVDGYLPDDTEPRNEGFIVIYKTYRKLDVGTLNMLLRCSL